MRMVVGIDASRNRSGGAKVHLAGILNNSDPREHGIEKVHVWSYASLLESLPDLSWIDKHNPPELERSLLHQIRWQYFSLPGEARRRGCSVLLNTDAGTVCPFRPAVVMSRDMLSYEKGEMKRFGLSEARLRLILLKYIQARSMRRADGVIFLTEYASRVIGETIGPLNRQAIIPHGVGEVFRRVEPETEWLEKERRPVRILYVSNVAIHKHQWMVVRAIGELRRCGHEVVLSLAGGGNGRAQKMLDEEIGRIDPKGTFVDQAGFVPHDALPARLAEADLFVFASSCENMPNTLVEAMAAGLPIACSSCGPMPEVLGDGGIYFDPEDPRSIADAIEKILIDPEMRTSIARRARVLSDRYSWPRCGAQTWEFLRTTVNGGKR